MLTAKNKPFNCSDFPETVSLALKILLEVPIELYPESRDKGSPVTGFCYTQDTDAQKALEIGSISKIMTSIYYRLATVTPLTC